MSYVDYRQAFVDAAIAEEDGYVGGQKYWNWAGTTDVDWCAIFVSYVAEQAGILGKLIYNSAGAGTIPRVSVSNGWGTWYNIGKKDDIVGDPDPNFIPQPGDLILLNPIIGEGDNAVYKDPMDTEYDGFYSSHIGIVIEVNEEKGTYITKEGNTSDDNGYYVGWGCVNSHTRTIGVWGNVNGFYRPNWIEREWISSNDWLGDYSDPFEPTKEQINNAIMVARYFINNDWTLEAICGMLGNMTYESSINPGVINSIGASGLVQWLYFEEEVKPWIEETFPDGDYTNEDTSKRDYYNGDYQCARIQHEADEGLMWGPYGYEGVSIPLEACGIFSLKQFSQSTGRSAYDLARYFLFHYERPESVSTYVQQQRGDAANTWYEVLSTCNEIYSASVPTISSVEQPNAKQVILKGVTGGRNGITKSVKLYYRWDGVLINPSNANTYDDCIMFKPQHTFEIKLIKPRLSSSILVVIVQESTDSTKSYTFKFSLTPSFPCLHIKDSSGKFIEYVPYVRDNNKMDLYVPIVKLNDGYYAIYNTDIEKISD